MKSLALLSTWAFLASGAISSALASSAYTCTVFRYGSAASTNATGINNKGEVVGYWNDASQIQHAFLREADGTLVSITTPGGSDQFIPAGINNLGQIAGDSFIRNPDGSFIQIAPPGAPPGSTFFGSQITGINDKGELSGSSTTFFSDGSATIQIFIRGTDGAYRTIDQSGTGSEPSLFAGSINNSDFVIEHTRYTDGYLLRPKGPKIPLLLPGVPPDSGFAGGVTGTRGLNNNNVTAAHTINFQSNYAFLRTTDGHFPAVVCPDAVNAQLRVAAVNDNNVVVGSLYPNPQSVADAAFIAAPTGVFPHAQLSNSSWTFSSHVTGETSRLGRVFVSNTGPADLHIPALYVGTTGQMHDQVNSFRITQTNCGKWIPEGFLTEPGTIPPGASCFVEFTFTPQVRGWQTAAIYIADDSPQSPETIEVGGTGIGGSLRLSNTSWNFAAHRVGETSGIGAIYAYNAGPGNVTFKGTQIVDAVQPSSFNLLSNTCGSPVSFESSTLPPYTTCSVTFNFAPSTPGEQTAVLHLNDDSINGPIQIPLSGYASRPRSYTITDLGTLGGSSASASAINDGGEVVGRSSTARGDTHPTLWQNGKIIDLSTFTSGGYRPSAALGINNKGQVVGLSENGVSQHVFLWQNGHTTDLGTLGGNSIVNGINNNGQVVGASDSPSGSQHAFLWQAGKMTDLGTLPGATDSSANAINDKGQVAGQASSGGGGSPVSSVAVMWQEGKIVDLQGLGGDLSFAKAINNKGQVVGSSSIKVDVGAPPIHAFLWQDGRIEDLTPGDNVDSSADAINDAGQIIGSAGPFVGGGELHTILWENGIVTDVGKLVPAEFGSVQGFGAFINNRGQIVLNVTRQGQNRAIVLTP